MLIIKIVGPTLVLLITLLQVYFDKIIDKRTRKYKRAKNGLLIVIIIAILFSITIVIIDDSNSKETINQLEKINSSLSESNKNSIKQEQLAKEERAALENRIISLNEKLDPFLKVALEKYPNQNENVALQNLIKDFHDLERKTEHLNNREYFVKLDKSKYDSIVTELKTTQTYFNDSIALMGIKK